MRILILPSWYFPAGSTAIAGRMFHHHAMALREAGVEAIVLYPDFSKKGPFIKKVSFEIEESVPTYRVSKWFPPRGNSFLFDRWIHTSAKAVLTYFKEHGQPDLIHAQSYYAAAIGAVVQQKSGVPFVYTERLSSFITQQIPKFHLPFFTSIFSCASMTTCVSPGLAAILQPHSHRTVRVVPNFYDEAIFYPDPSIAKDSVFTFISVGEPADTKGLDLLISAFALLQQKMPASQLRLILVDQIADQKELQKLAYDLGIDQQLTWTGLISQTELADLLRRSHALISASRVETFGKAIIEAQACGLPVIATKTDGATFILHSPKQGVLAELNDAESLTRGMGKVWSGYAEIKAEDIKKEVEKRFSKNVIIPQWINLYQSVLT